MLDYLFLSEEEIKLLTWDYPGFTSIFLFIISIAFFLFLNAFFVANEFASARVRLSQLRETEEDTKKEANKRAWNTPNFSSIHFLNFLARQNPLQIYL